MYRLLIVINNDWFIDYFVLLQVTWTMIKCFTKFVFNIMVLLSQSIIVCVSTTNIEKITRMEYNYWQNGLFILKRSLRYQKKLTSQYQHKTRKSQCSISINMKQNKQQLVFWWFQLFALGNKHKNRSHRSPKGKYHLVACVEDEHLVLIQVLSYTIIKPSLNSLGGYWQCFYCLPSNSVVNMCKFVFRSLQIHPWRSWNQFPLNFFHPIAKFFY